jgi:hypothetical protein
MNAQPPSKDEKSPPAGGDFGMVRSVKMPDARIYAAYCIDRIFYIILLG